MFLLNSTVIFCLIIECLLVGFANFSSAINKNN
jgi:hypothetical protein